MTGLAAMLEASDTVQVVTLAIEVLLALAAFIFVIWRDA